jgi:signal transduction histidine kinase
MSSNGHHSQLWLPGGAATEPDAGSVTGPDGRWIAARGASNSRQSLDWRRALQRALLGSRSRSELLQSLCELGVRFLGADGGDAWRFHAATRSLRLIGPRGREADRLEPPREIRVGGGHGLPSVPTGIGVFSCDAEWIDWWRRGECPLVEKSSGRVVGCAIGDRECPLGWVAWRFKTPRSISRAVAAMPFEISAWAPVVWHLRSRRRSRREAGGAAPAGIRRTALAARGLVHDLDNALLPLRCRVEALAAKVDGNEARRAIAGMAGTLAHLQDLTGDLRRRLDSSGRANGEPLRLDEWWQRARTIVEAMLPSGCILAARVPSGLAAVEIGEAQLTQAVCNLVSNAVAAIGLQGWIGVFAESGRTDGAVALAIEDDGPGIDSRRLASQPDAGRIDGNGRGSGLGLPLVRELLREVGGHLEITTRQGRGTRATLLLPKARGRDRQGSQRFRPMG